MRISPRCPRVIHSSSVSLHIHPVTPKTTERALASTRLRQGTGQCTEKGRTHRQPRFCGIISVGHCLQFDITGCLDTSTAIVVLSIALFDLEIYRNKLHSAAASRFCKAENLRHGCYNCLQELLVFVIQMGEGSIIRARDEQAHILNPKILFDLLHDSPIQARKCVAAGGVLARGLHGGCGTKTKKTVSRKQNWD